MSWANGMLAATARRSAMVAPCLLLVAVAAPEAVAAQAVGYIGPGAGLGMIGALFAVLAFVLLALLGPILYPIRLIRRRLRQRASQHATSREDASQQAASQQAASQQAGGDAEPAVKNDLKS